MTTRVTLIGDNAVNSGSIFNGTVNSEDLNRTAGQQAVTTDTIRDGAVTATKLQSSASNDAQRAVGTNHIQDKAVSAAKLADDTQAYLSFPLGGIVMWSGTIAQIPGGWYLCDGGTYGGLKTPDLRNRFIVGANDVTKTGTTSQTGPGFNVETGELIANYTPGDIGGFTAHKLTIDEMPAHVHSQGYQGSISNGIRGGSSGDVNQQVNTGSAGADDYHENRPPYYALAFIMKCEFREGSVATITTTVPTLQELRLNGPLYDQEMDGGAQKGDAGDVLTSLGDGNGVRWSSPVPVGAVFHFASSTAPTGYLIANGDLVPNGVGTVQGKTANFSALYAALGTTYGSVGKLPDLRGEFIRGWDNGRNVDIGRTLGTPQAETQIWNGIDVYYGVGGVRSGGESYIGGASPSAGHSQAGSTPHTAPIGSLGVRPRNIALLPCIKY